jgi:hypothetical protein
LKTFNVGIYIDMHDYHDVEDNSNGKDGTFNIQVEAKTSDAAMDKVRDDCVESNCPYACEPHTSSEVKEYAYS